jgi:hypothetical protein
LPAAADLAPCPAPDASPELPEFAPADELEEADEAEEVQ